jgi:hypothetical protein
MCNVKKYHGTSNTRIDECMEWVGYINQKNLKVVACCCGHGKYPMTIVVKNHLGHTWELISNKIIPRKRNFYKRDKQGYYFIPETIQSNQRICECSHKEWDEHKSSFYEYNGLKMVAQECNVKGCRCKKFKEAN